MLSPAMRLSVSKVDLKVRWTEEEVLEVQKILTFSRFSALRAHLKSQRFRLGSRIGKAFQRTQTLLSEDK